MVANVLVPSIKPSNNLHTLQKFDFGYTAEFGKFTTGCGKLGVVLLTNWAQSNSAPIWSKMLTESQRILSANCPSTTTTASATEQTTTTSTPTTGPLPTDILSIGGLSVGGAVVVMALLLVLRRRQ